MITGDHILETRNLSVRFGRQVVLRDIDLRVPRGQTLAIIGESGCGKTVLLKSLIGLIKPSDIGRRVALPNTLASSNADSPITTSRSLWTT